ncbi:MAG: uncharacterized protein QOI98_1720 [Solirubrobacteraceae bacterium]|nr:uncharacterized protein [Solirubrobacteraceae bacterium]
MRAVLDPNVLISALLSRDGTPARILRAWIGGEFDLVVSPKLLAELERALAYPKLERHVSPDESTTFVGWLRGAADLAADPETPPPVRSADPDDDYLLTLAADQRAALISGDKHLLTLSIGDLPIHTAAEFLSLLQAHGRS